MVESFVLLNDIYPFPSILDAGYPVFNLHLKNILFDVGGRGGAVVKVPRYKSEGR